MRNDIKKKRRYARRFYIFATLSIISLALTLCLLMEVLQSKSIPTDSQRFVCAVLSTCTSFVLFQTVLSLKGYSEITKVICIKRKLKKKELYNKEISEDYEQVSTMVEDKLFYSGINYLSKVRK